MCARTLDACGFRFSCAGVRMDRAGKGSGRQAGRQAVRQARGDFFFISNK